MSPDAQRRELNWFLSPLYITVSLLLVSVLPNNGSRAFFSVLIFLIYTKMTGFSSRLGTMRSSLLMLSIALLLPLSFVPFSEVSPEAGVELGRVLARTIDLLMVAIWEEFVFRAAVTNSFASQAVSSIVFAFIHSDNPGYGFLPAIFLITAALFLCAVRVRLGILPSVTFHFGWNASLGVLLGFPLSGLRVESLMISEMRCYIALCGGRFGPEGSIIAILLMITLNVLMRRGSNWFIRNWDQLPPHAP